MKNRTLSGVLAGFVFLAALSMAGCGSNSSTTPYIPPSHPGEPKFNYPSSVVAINVSGTETDLYVADTTNHTIRMVKIDSSSGAPVVTVSTFAGKAGVKGSKDDIGTAARFYSLAALRQTARETSMWLIRTTIPSAR